MSNFEDFGGKVTFEKGQNGEPSSLTINLADITRDEFRQMREMRQMVRDERDNVLPHCDIDFEPDHNLGAGKRLINALERRGFDVDVDKEERTIKISKDFDKEGGCKPLENAAERRAQAFFGREFHPVARMIHRDWVEDHPVRHALRERLVIRALRDS